VLINSMYIIIVLQIHLWIFISKLKRIATISAKVISGTLWALPVDYTSITHNNDTRSCSNQWRHVGSFTSILDQWCAFDKNR